MVKKIALLGGSGFVGSNISKVLEKQNYDFEIVSLNSSGHDLRKEEDNLKFIQDIQPDVIINCAAHVGSLVYVSDQAATIIDDNTRMISNLYSSLVKANCKALVINPIANCAYPANADFYREDEWMQGQVHRSVLAYGSTRRHLWATSESYKMQHQIKTINLFVPNMYGPFDSSDPNKAHALNALISKFVKAKLDGTNQVTIWGSGIAIREWLYAEDFGRILDIILKDKNFKRIDEPINIAQNFGLSILSLVEIIIEKFNFDGEIIWDKSKPDGAPKKVMEDTLFKKYFSNFEFTDFELGIEETIKYYTKIYPY